MKKYLTVAPIFIAACAISTGAWGQKVYRCGATYSQTPCANAVAVQADDVRTPEQKLQADQATTRDAATASALEKARLKTEAQAAAQGKPATKHRKSATAKDHQPTADTVAKKKGKKKKEAEFFTAKTATEEKTGQQDPKKKPASAP